LKLMNHLKWIELCQLKDKNMQLFGTTWKYNIENYQGSDTQILECQKWKDHDNNNNKKKKDCKCTNHTSGDGSDYQNHNHSHSHNHDQQIIIECPKHSDILTGRGKDKMAHPGNAILRNLVDSKLDEYIQLKSYRETTKLTLSMVYLLQQKYGARFLIQETIESHGTLGCWIEVPNEQARLKVRVLFRDKIKMQQKQKQLLEDKQQQQQQQQQKSQHNQQQKTQSVVSPPMQPSMMTIMMATRTDNNDNRQIQQPQHIINKEDNDSSTSMFLSMAGGGGSTGYSSGYSSSSNGSGSGKCSTFTGKKRQLQTTKTCFGGHLDCMN